MRQSPKAKANRRDARKVRILFRRADKAYSRKLRRSKDLRRNPEDF